MEHLSRTAEETYRQIAETTHDWIAMTDLDLKITYANRAARQVLGENPVGASIVDFTPPHLRETQREMLARRQAGFDGLLSFAWELTPPDGQTRIMDVQSLLIRENDQPAGLLYIARDVTQDRQTLARLKISEAKYRGILNGMADGYFEMDLDGQFTFVNDVICRRLGYTEEEILHLPSRNLQTAETQKNNYKVFQEVYRTGQTGSTGEQEIRHKDGNVSTVELIVSLIRDEGGQPVGFRCLARNIDERKSMQQALQQSEERYRSIIENMQEAYFENDLEGRITFVNDTACKHLGCRKEELIGHKSSDYQDEAGAKKTFAAYANLYQNGQPIKRLVSEFVRKDGSRGFYELTVDLIRDASGMPVGFRGVSRDISERKAMEEALRLNEERYRTILEDIDEGYFEDDLKGNFTFVSDALARNLGYPGEELIGANYRLYCNEETAANMRELFSRVYKTGDAFKNFRATFIAKNGDSKVHEFSCALIRSPEGKPVGFHGLSRDVTQVIREEEQRRREADRYRMVLEDINECYYELDLKGRFTFANDAQCRELGYTREELYGLDYRAYTEPSQHKQALELYNRVYRTGEPVKRAIGKYINKAGRKYSSEVSISLMKDREGRPIGFRGLSRNITDRLKMEETLRQSEEKYRTIIESIVDGYVEVALTGNWTFVNDVICGHTLYTREELLSMDFHKLHTKESAERAVACFTDVYLTGKHVKSLDVEIVRKDGSVGYYELSVSLMHDAAGKPAGFRCISRDVNDRRKIEEALKESEERYRSIVEQMQDGYFETDLAGTFTFLNPAACANIGYARDELLGIHNSQYQDEKTAREVYAVFNRIYKTGEPVSGFNFELTKKDGAKFITEISASLMRDEEGKPCGFRGLSRDVTARVLAQQELQKAKEAAEAANAAKSDFLANMSHEIRTPMNGVIGMIELLLDTTLSAEQRQYAQIVRNSSVALLSLLNDILDLSKIEAQKLDLEKLDFNLRLTIEDIADMVAVGAQDKGLELTALVDRDVPSLIKGDPGRLRQAIVNLTGNAVKFTPEGQIIIRVARVAEDEQSVKLRFSVTDTGIGIPADRREAIFAPFVQVDSSTTRKYGGTGLGLTITRQLAELMGGKIGCDSELCKGSTFWFTAVFEKQPDDRVQAAEVSAEISGSKILVVDDHATNRTLVCTLLSEWKCRWAEAEDAEEALKALRRAHAIGEPFNIALLDMMMPGMNGEELGRRIKADPDLRETRVIMMTSLGVRGDAARLALVGFDGFFTKPIRQSHLREALSMAIGRAKEKIESGAIITRHTIAESRLAGKKILVAEDNPTNQTVALALLKKLGYEADLAANGIEAVRAVKRVAYDLILMDCQMPDMDGYEATRLIRNRATGAINPDIPIIALTAHAMTEDRSKYVDAGMDDYLAKPVQIKMLAEMLSRWLTRTNGKGRGADKLGTPLEIRAPEKARIIFAEDEMKERMMDDAEVAGLIISRFLADMPGHLEALRGCLEKGDIAAGARHAHSIKGAAANVSAPEIQETAQKIQETIERRNLREAALLFPRLAEQLELYKNAVSKSGWLKISMP